MKFSHNLVNIIQLIHRKVFESMKLSSLTIYLDNDPLLIKIVTCYHVLKGMKLMSTWFLSLCTNTYLIKLIIVVVFITYRSSQIGAVVLVIRHWKLSCKLTTQFINSIDPDIQKSFCILEIVLAYDIAPIIVRISKPSKLAVSVLYNVKSTLKGFKA